MHHHQGLRKVLGIDEESDTDGSAYAKASAITP
jgi:hypothetical protein